MAVTGIVSKRLGSRYTSGRTRDWLKFKNPAAPAVKREAEEEWGRDPMAVNGRDLFAKADQQVSELKKRIARQHEVIKRAKLRGHSTAADETIQHTLHQTLRAFEKRRQQVFERMKAKREAE
jgi:hypothetical protein